MNRLDIRRFALALLPLALSACAVTSPPASVQVAAPDSWLPPTAGRPPPINRSPQAQTWLRLMAAARHNSRPGGSSGTTRC